MVMSAVVAAPTVVYPASWIQKTPGVCGGAACIRNTRITVFGLVEWRRLGRTDAEILASIDGLTADDLVLAWEYAAMHQEEIEEAIRQNAEGFLPGEEIFHITFSASPETACGTWRLWG
jgi:uncharacterized protein (DUF433 family)